MVRALIPLLLGFGLLATPAPAQQTAIPGARAWRWAAGFDDGA